MKLNKVTPCGNMVLLKLVEQKKKDEFEKKGALFVPTMESSTNVASVKNDKKTVIAVIEDFGDLIDPNKVRFKKGDEVYYNQFDLLTIGDDDGNLYGLTKSESILAVIEAERE